MAVAVKIRGKRKLRSIGERYVNACTHYHNGDNYPGIVSEDKDTHSQAWGKMAERLAKEFEHEAASNGYRADFDAGLYPLIYDTAGYQLHLFE